MGPIRRLTSRGAVCPGVWRPGTCQDIPPCPPAAKRDVAGSGAFVGAEERAHGRVPPSSTRHKKRTPRMVSGDQGRPRGRTGGADGNSVQATAGAPVGRGRLTVGQRLPRWPSCPGWRALSRPPCHRPGCAHSAPSPSRCTVSPSGTHCCPWGLLRGQWGRGSSRKGPSSQMALCGLRLCQSQRGSPPVACSPEPHGACYPSAEPAPCLRSAPATARTAPRVCGPRKASSNTTRDRRKPIQSSW